MSTLNPAREGAESWQAEGPVSGRRRSGMLQSYLSIVTMVVPAALLLGIGLLAGSPPAENDIERGVTIGAFEADGSRWEQAERDLQAAFDRYLETPITLEIGDRTVEVTPAELGISYDIEATHQRALAIGRGSIFTATRERLVAHTFGYTIDPVVRVDESQFMAVVGPLADDVLVAPVNATFEFDGERISVRPSSDGVGVDPAAGLRVLLASAVEVDARAIRIPTTVVAPDVTSAELEGIVQEARRLSAEPLLLLDGQSAWQFAPSDLAALITYRDGEITVDQDRLTARIEALAPAIEQDAVSADLVREESGLFTLVPGRPERSLDVDATSDAVGAAILEGEDLVDLVVIEQAPPVTREALLPLYRQLTSMVTRGVTLSWFEGTMELDRKAFSDSIVWNPNTGEFWFDHDRLAEALMPVAETASRAPLNLRWLNGQVVVDENASPGIRVDVQETIPNVIHAAMEGHQFADLVTHEDLQVDPAALGIEIKHVLGSSVTPYGDSSANRRTNIEVAARALNGVLIPPHSTFSFNDAIGGTATLEDGYQMGYGIVAEGGQVLTVPSVAGGICQVSTGVFQAAFWAGMPITHRTWHMYWIPRYGSGAGGLQGLDVTVDPDYGLDFNFYNPTDNWLAVVANANGQNLIVELWGVHQGWSVEVAEPVISDVVRASSETIRREDRALSPGQEVWVEQAQDGFKAAIHRVVKDAEGNVLDDMVFESSYQPASNVILVGPSS